ncbi:MAG: hypothetical protein KKH64_02925, partial [Candidatus Margulisbacteria bacterium]|nr:hypothetical protein [Candidatus Margulisiibacteriota bacterium]
GTNLYFYNGNAWDDLTVTGEGYWTRSGNNIYYDIGNVGIGTHESGVKLRVTLADVAVEPVWDTSRDVSIFENSDDNVAVQILTDNSHSGNIGFSDSDQRNVGVISYQHANNSMQFWTNNLQRVHISGNGKVGIGDTDPSQDLSVAGTIEATGAVRGDGITEFYQGGKDGLHQADGGSNNCDSWTEYSYTDYEQWNVINGLSDNQDIDIVHQINVPLNFTTWESTALEVMHKVSDGTGNNEIEIYVLGTDGNSVYSITSGLTQTSKTATTISGANLSGGTFTPGQTFIVIIKGKVDTGDNAYTGWVKGYYD